MSEFRLPSGEWRCTRDHSTEPCGECDGCREVQAENRTWAEQIVVNHAAHMRLIEEKLGGLLPDGYQFQYGDRDE